MEAIDRELILKLCEYDIKLKRLYEEHVKLEAVLAEYENRGFLTSAEQTKVKDLKKKKLAGVDKLMMLLKDHKEQREQNVPPVGIH